jgi:uroporphyrinogen decarboxylase
MNRKERLRAMVRGGSIDRLPSQLDFVPHRLRRLLEELRMGSAEFDRWADNHFFHVYPLSESCYYSSGSPEDQKLIDLAVARGLIERHPDSRCIYDNFGVSWLKNLDGIRDVDNPLKGRDLAAFPWPDPQTPGIFDHVADGLTRQRDEQYVVGLQHLLLHERAYLLLGYNEYMMALADDPGLVEELLDRILDFHLGLARRFIELGVDAVRTGDDYGTQLGLQMDPALWRRLIKPRLARLWGAYREAGVTVMLHSCGNIESILPDLIEIGLEVLHPIQPLAMSPERLSQRFGEKLVFHGGIDTQQLLPFGRPSEVREAVRRCVATLGRHRRYIIAPSQEIMNDVPTSNILALLEGIREQR